MRRAKDLKEACPTLQHTVGPEARCRIIQIIFYVQSSHQIDYDSYKFLSYKIKDLNIAAVWWTEDKSEDAAYECGKKAKMRMPKKRKMK